MLIASTWILTASSAHQPLSKCHGKRWFTHQREGIESRKQRDFVLFSSWSACKVNFYISIWTAVEGNQKGEKTIALALNLMLNEVKSFKLECWILYYLNYYYYYFGRLNVRFCHSIASWSSPSFEVFSIKLKMKCLPSWGICSQQRVQTDKEAL